MSVAEQKPWHDDEKLERLYHGEGLTQTEIGERLGCSGATISTWMQKYDIKSRSPGDWLEGVDTNPHPDEAPWRDEDVLREMYVEEELNADEIAEELGCSQRTIVTWLDEYGIKRRGRGKSVPRPMTVVGGTDEGYEKIVHMVDGVHRHVAHHRLLAVSEYGFDSVVDKVVHHRNEIPWDNRPKNIELMDRAEHTKYHKRE